MFESVEEIPVREGVNCEKCKLPTHHQRKISISKAPPILIIHLKRFKIINNTKKKIDQYINFPLYDLDMSPFIFKKNQEGEFIYDLYGIVNHYGSINGGHYISFIKNERTNVWWQYDDSSVKQIGESLVRSQFAYILFYKRRDIMTQSLDQVYPSVSLKTDRFYGKPIRVKQEGGKRLCGYLQEVQKIDGVETFILRMDKGQVLHATIDQLESVDRDDISDLQKSEAYIKRKEEERLQKEWVEKEQKREGKGRGPKSRKGKKDGEEESSSSDEKEEKEEGKQSEQTEKNKSKDQKKSRDKKKNKNKDCSIY